MRLLTATLALAAIAAPVALPDTAQAQDKRLHFAPASGPTMVARPATPASGIVAVRGGAFRCDITVCSARSSQSRPMILCQRLAKQVGTLEAFTVDGVRFDDRALAACNARAGRTTA